MFDIRTILNFYKKKGYEVDRIPYKVNILGVRNNINNVTNKFDDHIVTFYRESHDLDQDWKVNIYPATTDPGKFYLNNLLNPKGTAILKLGQYKDSHQIGLHRGKYKALKQTGNVTVWRDGNKDDKLNYGGYEDTGLFGINIHRASKWSAVGYIGKYSAGCQVIQNPIDFEQFIEDIEWSNKIVLDSFNYTLCNYTDLIPIGDPNG